MPLMDRDLQRDFVQADENETVADALKRLRAQGGGDEWHVFVACGPETFSALQVRHLKQWFKHLGPALFNLRFSELRDRLAEAQVVQRQVIDIETANRMALRSPASVVVALQEAQVEGYVHAAVKSVAEVFPGSTMGQLYSNYITQHPNARAEWQPAGVEPPICPLCNYQGFYRYRAEDGAFVCSACGGVVPE
jgi:hypothetical protein